MFIHLLSQLHSSMKIRFHRLTNKIVREKLLSTISIIIFFYSFRLYVRNLINSISGLLFLFQVISWIFWRYSIALSTLFYIVQWAVNSAQHLPFSSDRNLLINGYRWPKTTTKIIWDVPTSVKTIMATPPLWHRSSRRTGVSMSKRHRAVGIAWNFRKNPPPQRIPVPRSRSVNLGLLVLLYNFGFLNWKVKLCHWMR